MIFARPASKKWQHFETLKKVTFSQMCFGKIKKTKTLSLSLVNIMGKGFYNPENLKQKRQFFTKLRVAQLTISFNFCVSQANQRLEGSFQIPWPIKCRIKKK